MKIYIKAKPKSKKTYMRRIDDTHYIIAVHEPPVAGKANLAIIRALAEYFKKSASQIILVSGQTSKQKIFDIPLTSQEIQLLEPQTQLC